jgi:hypothetical protein
MRPSLPHPSAPTPHPIFPSLSKALGSAPLSTISCTVPPGGRERWVAMAGRRLAGGQGCRVGTQRGQRGAAGATGVQRGPPPQRRGPRAARTHGALGLELAADGAVLLELLGRLLDHLGGAGEWGGGVGGGVRWRRGAARPRRRVQDGGPSRGSAARPPLRAARSARPPSAPQWRLPRAQPSCAPAAPRPPPACPPASSSRRPCRAAALGRRRWRRRRAAARRQWRPRRRGPPRGRASRWAAGAACCLVLGRAGEPRGVARARERRGGRSAARGGGAGARLGPACGGGNTALGCCTGGLLGGGRGWGMAGSAPGLAPRWPRVRRAATSRRRTSEGRAGRGVGTAGGRISACGRAGAWRGRGHGAPPLCAQLRRPREAARGGRAPPAPTRLPARVVAPHASSRSLSAPRTPAKTRARSSPERGDPPRHRLQAPPAAATPR